MQIINQPSYQSQQISVRHDFTIDATNSVVNPLDIIGQVTNTINETMQKKAKKAVGFLKVISEGLEPATKVVGTIKNIIPAILAFFGL